MTQQSSTFSHICRLVPSDPPLYKSFIFKLTIILLLLEKAGGKAAWEMNF